MNRNFVRFGVPSVLQAVDPGVGREVRTMLPTLVHFCPGCGDQLKSYHKAGTYCVRCRAARREHQKLARTAPNLVNMMECPRCGDWPASHPLAGVACRVCGGSGWVAREVAS